MNFKILFLFVLIPLFISGCLGGGGGNSSAAVSSSSTPSFLDSGTSLSYNSVIAANMAATSELDYFNSSSASSSQNPLEVINYHKAHGYGLTGSGETIAILGKTGSGKSTIINLISRLYDTTEGTVFIDDIPIKECNLNSIRSQIGFVPQDPFLFSESIEDNIKFGKENATEEEIITAAKNAVVHNNIIGFKDSYKTILGERGVTLSGGQKQRVSIARAIIKDPEILIFDDCLSAVDTETEERILENLKKISKHKTTFIISHRVSSAKNADTIIILDEGEIIQEGTHNELITEEGYYKELYEQQLLEKES